MATVPTTPICSLSFLRAHAPPLVQALAGAVDNALSAGASTVSISLVGDKLLVVESDTQLRSLSQALQLLPGKGPLNNFGFGSKVLLAALGRRVTLVVLRQGTDGQITAARTRCDDANRLTYTLVPDAASLTTEVPDLARVLASLARDNPGRSATVFAYHCPEGAPLHVPKGRSVKRTIVVDDQTPNLAQTLQGMYVGKMPQVWVENVQCLFKQNPLDQSAFRTPLSKPTPLYLPGAADPFAWVSCARLEAKKRLDPYREARSGAVFTYGPHKILQTSPYVYFTGAVLGLVGDYNLNLKPFDSGTPTTTQHDELVRFVSCGDPGVEELVQKVIPFEIFATWAKPRDALLWSRVGVDVLAHVHLNPDVVAILPGKDRVECSGVSPHVVLARLRFHILCWCMTDHARKRFVPPFGTTFVQKRKREEVVVSDDDVEPDDAKPAHPSASLLFRSVELLGLIYRSELNGTRGTVVGWDNGRYVVRVHDGNQVRLKPECVRLPPS